MNITGGYHYHTVRADSEEILDKIENQLSIKGYIAPGESGLFEEFDSSMYTCSGNQLSMGNDLHRTLYNMGVRKITCTITSAGVSETVEFSFS
jgi:hypothetical protein